VNPYSMFRTCTAAVLPMIRCAPFCMHHQYFLLLLSLLSGFCLCKSNIRLEVAARQKRVSCKLLVKLGGSAITQKNAFETLEAEALHTTAQQLSSLHDSRIVIVHGAGSFGHFQASQHGVSKGKLSDKFSWNGFAQVRSSVTRLNTKVVEALLQEGVPGVGCSPFPLWKKDTSDQLCRQLMAASSRMLDNGLVPVIHGDAVLTSVERVVCGIVGGDDLIQTLCDAGLRPDVVVFLTDVAGVYDRPPEEEGAQLLKEIRVTRSGQICSQGSIRTSTAAHDVTGGVAAKIDAALKIAAKGIPVIIVQVGTEHAAAAFRNQIPEVATCILPEDYGVD